MTFLREYPSSPPRFGHTIDGQDVRTGAQVGAITLGSLMDLVKGIAHRVLERLVDALLAPEKRILVLHPFVIADSHAAGVSQDVGNYHHTLVFKNTIGGRGRRSIRQLGNYLRFHGRARL